MTKYLILSKLAHASHWQKLSTMSVKCLSPDDIADFFGIIDVNMNQRLGSAFGREDFSRIVIFVPLDFFTDLSPDFSFFRGGKSPAKPSKICARKSPTHVCRGADKSEVGHMRRVSFAGCKLTDFAKARSSKLARAIFAPVSLLPPLEAASDPALIGKLFSRMHPSL